MEELSAEDPNSDWVKALGNLKDTNPFYHIEKPIVTKGVLFHGRNIPKVKGKTVVNKDKVLVLNPSYLSIDNRQDGEIEYLKSEMGQDVLDDPIAKAADKVNVPITVIDSRNLAPNETSKFNAIRNLNDWVEELMISRSSKYTLPYNQAEIKKIQQSYQTKYVMVSGVISLHQKNIYPYLIPVSLLVWPTTPFFIGASLKPKYDMMYYVLLFNLETNQKEVISFNYFKAKATPLMLESHYYIAMQRTKRVIDHWNNSK